MKVHEHCYKKFNWKPVESANVASDANGSLDNQSSTCYSKSNYEKVKENVRDVVINKERPASMKLLHESYELGIGNSNYRHQLKTRLQTDFGKCISFLSQQSKILNLYTCIYFAIIKYVYKTNNKNGNVKN